MCDLCFRAFRSFSDSFSVPLVSFTRDMLFVLIRDIRREMLLWFTVADRLLFNPGSFCVIPRVIVLVNADSDLATPASEFSGRSSTLISRLPCFLNASDSILYTHLHGDTGYDRVNAMRQNVSWRIRRRQRPKRGKGDDKAVLV